jgi:hypothetical protein
MLAMAAMQIKQANRVLCTFEVQVVIMVRSFQLMRRLAIFDHNFLRKECGHKCNQTSDGAPDLLRSA